MNIEFLSTDHKPIKNDAILDYEEIDRKLPIEENLIEIWHSNQDDGYYSYKFRVDGTKEEIEVIKEFCEKLMEAE